MKKNLFLLLVLLGGIFFTCKNESGKPTSLNENRELSVNIIDPNTGEVFTSSTTVAEFVDQVESRLYQNDSSAYASTKEPAKYHPGSAQIFYVAKWNTPSLLKNGESDGGFWDGNVFLGCKDGGMVYFPETYEAYSEKFKATNDSTFAIEKCFPTDGVTQDPRLTCWWLSTITEDLKQYTVLDSFLNEATLIRGDVKFKDELQRIKNAVLKTKGRNWQEQVRNYTAATAGDPAKWDAWKYPGYYGRVVNK